MTRPALLLAVALPALALGACSGGPDLAGARPARFASLDAAVAPVASRKAAPVATMPAWIGRPTRVIEREDPAGFEQSIALSLSARGDAKGNAILVSVRRAGSPSPDSPIPMGKPTQDGIRAELDAAFPGIAMQVATRPASNAHGPYGLAIGRAQGGARCLYAWQWIEDARGATGEDAPAALRVRLCRDDITLEAMAAAVNQLRLAPRGEADVALRAEAPPQAKPRRRARIVARRPRIDAVAERPAPSRAIHQLASPRPMAALAPQAAPARRYLAAEAAPSEPSPSRAERGAPVVAPILSAELPPEAYRGPSRSR